MEYHNMLRLQICLYLNLCLYCVWIPVVGFFLYVKINRLGHLSKYLSISVYTLLCTIEGIRLYLGNLGNLSSRVPELAGFLMISVLMQMPLVSFFLLNPYLYSAPTEIILHTILALLATLEIIFGFSALKHASSVAKGVYLTHCKK